MAFSKPFVQRLASVFGAVGIAAGHHPEALRNSLLEPYLLLIAIQTRIALTQPVQCGQIQHCRNGNLSAAGFTL
jgi:hypothetical protein